MLVLSRKKGEQVYLADNIQVTIISVNGSRVRLGFNAPASVSIHRAEIQQRVDQEQVATRPLRDPPPYIEGAAACT